MKKYENEETLKRILVEFREDGVPDDLRERRTKIEPAEGKANTIAGVRRSGKTYLMYQLIGEREEEKAYYINYEDERIINPSIEDLSNLLPTIRETFEVEKPIFLFVDEVQNAENWEKWARRMAEKKDVFLILSGSSSKLTSREIATSLRGRALTTYLFPLSFEEFLDFKEVEYEKDNIEYSSNKPDIRRHFHEYLKYGGFPEVVLEEDKRRKLRILREYFSTIVARDIVERYSIDRVRVLETFMKFLVNNFARKISFSKAENWLNSLGLKTSKSTLIRYFDHMKKSFFLFDTTIFSGSVKDRLQYPRKVYLIDNGFAESLTERFDLDRGWFFENEVGITLYREIVSNPNKEFHYWESGDKEVDFVLKDSTRTEGLIQVCSDLNERNREREVGNLLEASEDLECDNLMVITDDYIGEEKADGKKIKFVPLWKWLLESGAEREESEK